MSNQAERPRNTCVVCGYRDHNRPLGAIRPSIVAMLRSDGVELDPSRDAICQRCYTATRMRHARLELERERGELSEVEHEIAARAATHTAIADLVERGAPRGVGQRAADTVARVGGSWRFVLGFGAFLLIWISVNVALGLHRAFDPYPFILLNLVLSCLAATQAPIIMMSQTRMAEIDRARAAQDFRVNLKAELEVAALHEKMDHLLHQQWDRLVELQDLQLEILQQLRGHHEPVRK